LWKLKQKCLDPFEAFFKTDQALLNSHELLVALALPLLGVSLALFNLILVLETLQILFVAPALERESFLIVSGNLLDERGLVANQQRHRFRKVISSRGFSRGHRPQFTTAGKRIRLDSPPW
jgi:hypothetical protein